MGRPALLFKSRTRGPVPTARPPLTKLSAHSPGCPRLGPQTPLPSREQARSAGAPLGSGSPPIAPAARLSGSHPRLHLPFWPLACGGFPERVCPLGKREDRTPCLLAEGNVGQVLDRTGHRATSRCLAVAILSWVRNRGGGAPAGSPPCPRAPRWLEVRFSPRAGACQTKGLASGVPRGHASQPFCSLRSRQPSVAFAETETGAALRPRVGRVSLAAAAATLPLYHVIPRGGGIVRLLLGVQESLLRRDP